MLYVSQIFFDQLPINDALVLVNKIAITGNVLLKVHEGCCWFAAVFVLLTNFFYHQRLWKALHHAACQFCLE